jgi:hypothetical protein
LISFGSAHRTQAQARDTRSTPPIFSQPKAGWIGETVSTKITGSDKQVGLCFGDV